MMPSIAQSCALGQDIERSFLTRVVRWHVANRVIVTNNKTVAFN